MKHLTSLIALALGTVAFQAHAQDSAATPPDQGASAPASPSGAVPPPSTAAPSTGPADATANTQVTDTEVDQFAQATVKVQKIQADATLDQAAKQQQMAAAVTGAGLQPARYNQIAKAVPGDSALRARVQTAMAKYATPPQG